MAPFPPFSQTIFPPRPKWTERRVVRTGSRREFPLRCSPLSLSPSRGLQNLTFRSEFDRSPWQMTPTVDNADLTFSLFPVLFFESPFPYIRCTLLYLDSLLPYFSCFFFAPPFQSLARDLSVVFAGLDVYPAGAFVPMAVFTLPLLPLPLPITTCQGFPSWKSIPNFSHLRLVLPPRFDCTLFFWRILQFPLESSAPFIDAYPSRGLLTVLFSFRFSSLFSHQCCSAYLFFAVLMKPLCFVHFNLL